MNNLRVEFFFRCGESLRVEIEEFEKGQFVEWAKSIDCGDGFVIGNKHMINLSEVELITEINE